jgi:receptor expression-enhancing protein 5/6
VATTSDELRQDGALLPRGSDEKGSERRLTVEFVPSLCGIEVDRRMAICGSVLLLAAFVGWGIASELVFTVLAYLYPMYASFLALSMDEPKAVRHWLRYWVTFAVLYLVEFFAYPLLATFRYHHLVRICFVVWLFLPVTGGAQLVYCWLLQPVLRRYRPLIDKGLTRSAELQTTLGKESETATGFRAMTFLSSCVADGIG